MFFAKKALPMLTYGGLLIGFVGVANLLSPDSSHHFNYLHALPIIFSCMCWALGSILPKKLNMSKSTYSNLGTQLFSGSIFFWLISYLSGEFTNFHVENITLKSVLALSYLINFGAIIVFPCLNWLLKNCDSAKVATYGFINPIIAVIIGNVFASEPITMKVIVSASIILLGVMIIIFGNGCKTEKVKTDINNSGIKELSYDRK